MEVLAALKAALELAASVAEQVHDQKLMDAGESTSLKDSLAKGLSAIEAANRAAAAVDNSKEAIAHDPNNLDR